MSGGLLIATTKMADGKRTTYLFKLSGEDISHTSSESW